MGRLTLNILLSFAQFEREIISERTRDKMSAARRKGKWVGGHPVLGYDVHPQGGRLVVNPEEAAQVRAIYQLYLEHQAMIPVVQELQRRGWSTKQWTTKKGRELGGKTVQQGRSLPAADQRDLYRQREFPRNDLQRRARGHRGRRHLAAGPGHPPAKRPIGR
jgi:DNA invertase Pin-like site-specific DNA recombinase